MLGPAPIDDAQQIGSIWRDRRCRHRVVAVLRLTGACGASRGLGQDRLMASRVPFYFVDVFASRPLTGNPLSLVPDADGLGEVQMRAIAREFNQSETTFLLRPSLPGAAVRLRSFTPIGAEVGGEGHNALGAWLWMEAAGRLPSAGGNLGFRQQIVGQVLPVEVIRRPGEPATVWMDQSPPRTGAVVRDRTALAAALGLIEAIWRRMSPRG